MAKYLSVLLNQSVDSGTTSSATTNKLVESGQNFLSTVTVGDIVVNTTDGTTTTVTAIDSNTTLSLAADIMGSTKAYTIYSATNKVEQIVNIEKAILVQQASSTTTTIALSASSASTDIITLTHGPVGSSAVTVRLAVQDAILKAESPKYKPLSKIALEMPTGIAAISLAVA